MGDLQLLRRRLVPVTGVGDLPLEGGHDIIFFSAKEKAVVLFIFSPWSCSCVSNGSHGPRYRERYKRSQPPTTSPPPPATLLSRSAPTTRCVTVGRLRDLRFLIRKLGFPLSGAPGGALSERTRMLRTWRRERLSLRERTVIAVAQGRVGTQVFPAPNQGQAHRLLLSVRSSRHAAMPIHSRVVQGCLHAAMATVSGCARNAVVHRPRNIYCPVF